MTEKEFNNLFHTWFDPVRRYLYYRCGDQDLATDIAQEAFVKVWEKNLLPAIGKPAGLLFKIARDLLVSHYRKEKVKQNYRLNLKITETNESPEDSLVYQELIERYNNLLTRMPEKQRTVFLLSRIDDLTYNEIAVRQGIGVKAVEKRMNLALKLIRKELGDYGKY